jgi:S1-C subfamily serine protease
MRLTLIVAALLIGYPASTAYAQPAVDRLEEQIRGRQPAPMAADPQPGYLGAILDDRQVDTGVAVIDVLPQGPADAAGMRVGDVIVNVNGKPVRQIDDMSQFVRASAAGTRLKFQVRRGEETREVEVSLGVRPNVADRAFPDFGQIPAPPPLVEQPRPGGLLGVRAEPLDARSRLRLRVPVGRGAIITTVVVGSPAARAGLPTDAVIIALDGQAVNSPDDLSRLVTAAGPGREIELAYYQGDQLIRQRLRLAADGPSAEQRIVELERRVLQLEQRIEQLERRLAQ